MTQDEIIEMANQVGASPSSNPDEYDVLKITYCELEAFAKLVAEKEREACAEVCDDIHAEHEAKGAFSTYAEAIRARGQA